MLALVGGGVLRLGILLLAYFAALGGVLSAVSDVAKNKSCADALSDKQKQLSGFACSDNSELLIGYQKGKLMRIRYFHAEDRSDFVDDFDYGFPSRGGVKFHNKNGVIEIQQTGIRKELAATIFHIGIGGRYVLNCKVLFFKDHVHYFE